MAEKGDKAKKAGAKRQVGEKSVMATLPSTRSERIGTRRASATAMVAPAPKTAAAKAAKTTPKTAAEPAATTAAKTTPEPAAKTAPKAAAKTAAKAAGRRPRATATRRKAAAPRTFEPTPAAEAAAGAADERAAGATLRVEPPTYPRPRPVREGAPGIGGTGYREQASSERGRASGTELVTTTVQAAGALAQLGLSIGSQIVKRAVDRLPKP
jgi:hypothetical protein